MQLTKQSLEETLAQFIKISQDNFKALTKSRESADINNEGSIKNFETHIGQLSKQMGNMTNGSFASNTIAMSAWGLFSFHIYV